MKKEIWKTVPPFEEWQVSTLGRVRKQKSGRVVTQRLHGGYLAVRLRGIRVMVHQLVMVTFKGPWPEGKQVSYINEGKLDNRLLNLEWSTPRENSNMPLHRKRVSASRPIGKSGFRGIYKQRQKWVAQVRVDDKVIYIGTFDTPRKAAITWDKYVRNHRLPRTTNARLGLL